MSEESDAWWRIVGLSRDELPVNDSRVLRIIDVNANRAVEGLRTAEDYTRFVLDEPLLTATLKDLRHDLVGAMRHIPETQRLAARNARGDIGPSIECDAASTRGDAASVAGAAIGRAIEALRSLEEFGKLIDLEFAARVESLRYRAYSLASSIALLPVRKRRLESVRLYLLIEGGKSDEELVANVRRLSDAGVDCFQLRDKRLDDATLYARAQAGAAAARRAGALWIINDRADIAVATGADGVHVGQDELPIEAVRKVLGSEQIVGVSTHDPAQLADAVRRGADYVGCGPVFPSGTKAFSEFAGIGFLRQAAGATQLPAFAIGGIGLGNVAQVVAAGFSRVAIAGGILGAEDPVATARQIKKVLVSSETARS